MATTDRSTRRGKRILVGVVIGALGASVGIASALPAAADEPTATIRGVVAAEDGTVGFPAEVSIYSTAGGAGKTITPAADGSFELTGLAPGNYTIGARDTRPIASIRYDGEWWDGQQGVPDYVYDGVEIPAGTTDIRFELDAMDAFLVTAVNADGDPLTGILAHPQLQNAETGEWEGLGHDAPRTNADGQVLLNYDEIFRFCLADNDWDRNYRPKVRHATSCWGASAENPLGAPIDADGQGIVPVTMTLEVAGLAIWHEWPIIHGTGRIGDVLTIEPGFWGPVPITLTYQWLRTDGTPIPGATSPTFTPTADLSGTYISARITGTAPGYAPAVYYTNQRVGSATPTVSDFRLTGSATPGTTVTASWGEVAPTEASTYLTWYVDGVDQNRYDNSPSLAITDEMAGRSISAVLSVYYTTPGTTSDGWSRRAFASIPAATTSATPTITGTPAVGATLTAVPGEWKTGTLPTTLAYQWLRGGAPIAGATASTYVLTDADANADVAVRVTGGAYLYPDVAVTSASVRFAAAPSTVIAGTPRVLSPAAGSRILTADAGDWGPSGVALSYQWFRDGVAIAGATAPQVKYDGAALFSKYAVAVTGTVAGSAPVTKTSVAVYPGPARTPKPGSLVR